ncbi:NAD(P)-dependent dehydrogenase, short-chain alcohol dehydrogenase family [Salegentibacter echinorum]|uniref:NAD(P)-dependent dehydrogenase, short-chain alcohol dehydrogenase family n=1 Tax=Salegentibacter echinorum TaxID=1073325 RepID=A0A1M5FI11_SALEC|nr:SDR family oxidoreductase [Salegentibacter echinorum]SHF91126.1 NAD(P)-dependent dehydrogenase, short-chain alcohol dehydrogenase family [Salegentibacter echinorum]
MYGKLEDKVVIVTGSNGLIGKEVVVKLQNAGAVVIALDLTQNGKENNFITCDITKEKEIDEVVARVLNKYNRIDGLVNLAYPRTADWGAKFEEIPLSSWKRNIDMQLNSSFYLCQSVLKVMKEQEWGAIVNIGSIYGVVGNDFSLYEEYNGTSPAAYAAVKGGLINFTKYLASYYGKYGIRVNCVSPGGILDESKQHPSFIKRYSEKSPMGRLAKPEEMVAPIAFLLSDGASFITGHNLMVDGGWTAV